MFKGKRAERIGIGIQNKLARANSNASPQNQEDYSSVVQVFGRQGLAEDAKLKKIRPVLRNRVSILLERNGHLRKSI